MVTLVTPMLASLVLARPLRSRVTSGLGGLFSPVGKGFVYFVVRRCW